MGDYILEHLAEHKIMAEDGLPLRVAMQGLQ